MECNVEAVLFDLGGVLVRLDSLDNVLGSTGLTPDALSSRWLTSGAVRAFDAGRCSVDEFAERLVTEFELESTPEQLIERFTHLPQGLFPGAIELVRSVPASITTGLLSNTNELHWATLTDVDVVRCLCQRNYLSFELGFVKPDRAIFDHVVADLDLDPRTILFVDDNQINVDGARAAGLSAECAKGPAAAATALRAHHVIT